jgi:hypothetical protein
VAVGTELVYLQILKPLVIQMLAVEVLLQKPALEY